MHMREYNSFLSYSKKTTTTTTPKRKPFGNLINFKSKAETGTGTGAGAEASCSQKFLFSPTQ